MSRPAPPSLFPAPADVPERTACLWCPDWPVVALRSRDPGLRDTPVAVVERSPRGLVVRAASAEARAEGVTMGLRRREAENRCPGLVVVDADPHVEARVFEAVARTIEAFTPRLALERPGRLSFPTRGPARYFGGDASLAAKVLGEVGGRGIPDARLGVADGTFAAGLAARAAPLGDAHVVAPGGSPAFLASWPVAALGDAGLADLLIRLGLRTLGAFAELPASAVLGRFGPSGARAHQLACGLDEQTAALAEPPPELAETAELDPPVIQVETAAFVAKSLAERLLARLEALGLACIRVTIEAETEHGERLARCWRHEGALTSAALAARVRWQLEGWLTGRESAQLEALTRQFDGRQPPETLVGDDLDVTAGLTLLRLVPDEVVAADGRQLGFWGGDQAAGDRAARVLARVQGMLGHPAVVTAVPQGGRTPAERVRWVPWGDPRELARPIGAVRAPGANVSEVPPWPGAVTGPAPARVFDPPVPAELLDDAGQPVTVSGRGDASGPPARLRCAALPGEEVTAWAGPWAHDLRWWDCRASTRCARWQLVIAPGVACLVALTKGRATIEAIYD